MRQPHRALCSGDVLLSHGLSPYYHRGCSVSLPCSEWERVGPLRNNHQSAEPHGRFAAVAATQARCRTLETMSIFQRTAGSLISTYRFRKISLRLRFVLRSFVSSVCRSACAERVNRKVKDQAERVISTPELNMLPCL